MSAPQPAAANLPARRIIVALGIGQTLGYASTYYLPAILAGPMAQDMGLPLWAIFAGLSGALVIASILAPIVGRIVDAHGGRRVLLASSLLFAAGLMLLSRADGVGGLAAGWTVIGIGMACGLYDVAFSTLAGLFGRGARGPITGITLIAGFASTIGWPFTAWIAEAFGWREACQAWAALHLLVGFALYAGLPGRANAAAPDASSPTDGGGPRRAMAMLAFVFAAQGVVNSGIGTHLPGLLMAAGATPAAAIAAAALLGPAQVAARLAEFGLMRRMHPLVSARVATMAHPAGVAALLVGGPAAAPLFAALHGGGSGLLSISRGALPLALFGPAGYGRRQGLIVAPANAAVAAAPLVIGLGLEAGGPSAVLVLTTILAGLATVSLLALRPAVAPAGPAIATPKA
ncbi:MFS transporter [Roseomonas eburnea]|uniref:MFS transporter n=1 Tax=Neoroseomonas eburnea TaxID=1346889 RepID=A0A9X9XK82_9PROT|nr:MFS transporter [Neoroseomonas eburnea]MBR0684118.1 MFS transporter [Neoroseomonas eburnea]